MAKKKGPPYTDDPGCKYIVIDDPWPGTKQGRDRKDNFFNLVGMWVYFMLNRKDIPESIFSVNTVRGHVRKDCECSCVLR